MPQSRSRLRSTIMKQSEKTGVYVCACACICMNFELCIYEES